MKKILLILLAAVVLNSCSTGQNRSNLPTTLSATEFSEKIKGLPAATIVDVRTPDEFSKGHLVNALNCDWNGDAFEQQIATIDKSQPVFVYCLSGGRSSSAANKMRSEGFETVYELAGGIMKWRAAQLPETSRNASKTSGLTKQQLEELIQSNAVVLIDFYADWCAPCKKMKSYLDDISNELSGKVKVVRINADENQSICTELHIDALPVVHLYKNNELLWSNTGFVEKAVILNHLNSAVK